MTVLEDAKSTLERLDKVRAAAVGADEAKALELLRIALVELATPIGHLATSARLPELDVAVGVGVAVREGEV